jgi:choline/glycine/proline betaine transport protein
MKVNKYVFWPSAILITLLVAAGAIFTDVSAEWIGSLQNFIVSRMGWFYSLVISFFLGFVIWLLFSDYGDIVLGEPDEEPEYPFLSWFAMLFSAGIGIGLFFFGVAEPMLHFIAPREANPETVAAAKEALTLTYFHWGLHGWALYVVVGLGLAFFSYRHDLPLTFRSTLYPLIGERIYGRIGDLTEVLAVFATMFGVATSLGLGVMHVNAGLHYLGWIEISLTNQIILIAVITLAATVSVVSGLDRGIRRLSEINFGLGVILLVFVLVAGPTLFLVESFVESLGHYGSNLLELSFRTDAYQPDSDWQKNWTLFYWGWWIAWSPFVGMFIARISRGRTVRQFVVGVLFGPCLFIFVWMTIFGNSALSIELFGAGGMVEAVQKNEFVAFYVLLDRLPWSTVTIFVATLSGAIYFVTSSDSASLIIDILTSSDINPPVGQRIFWALIEGAVAGVLLMAGGKQALQALQAASLIAALPFALVLLCIAYSLVVGLRAAKNGEPLDPPMG